MTRRAARFNSHFVPLMLDLNKLQNAHGAVARLLPVVPLLLEAGGDRKGEHLFLKADGRFGCVRVPG